MNHRNVGSYGSKPMGNQSSLEAVGVRVKSFVPFAEIPDQLTAGTLLIVNCFFKIYSHRTRF
jgi:hypothetical protein